MRVLLYIFLIAGLILPAGACKKYLDINDNPNAAKEVEPGLLFTTSTVQHATKRTDGDLWIPIALAGQTISSGGFNPDGWGVPAEEQYNFDPLIFGNPWNQIYTVAGSGLEQAIVIAESAAPVNHNAAAQAKVLKAIIFYDATTIYGDIPFSEALNTDITYPEFDTQQEVFEQLLALLDEALAQFDEGSELKISSGDLIYNGDIAKWIKLARSLKLKVLMTMVDKDPSKADAIGRLLTEGGMISAAEDNALLAFSTASGRENPKFALINNFFGKDENGDPLNPFFASKRAVDFMNSIDDPRLPLFFKRPAGQPNFVGLANGADGDDAIHSRLSMQLQRADEPEYFFNYQEQLFFEAEVYARGLGLTEDLSMADDKLRSAVEASARLYGVSAGEAAAFAQSLPALTSFPTARDAVKYIHMHHWIDEMDRPIDAFTQWRRSGPEGDEVPALTPPIGAIAGGLFRRYEYPQTNEILANPNAPQDRIKYDVKMWFDL